MVQFSLSSGSKFIFLQRLFILALSLTMCEMPSALAQAHGNRDLKPLIKYESTYDDNVLGLPSHMTVVEAIGMKSKSDHSHTLEVGVLFDKKYRRQHFNGNLKASKTQYDTYKVLNFEGRDIAFNWNWALGSHLEGKIGTSYVRGLPLFTEFQQLISNVRTHRREYLDVAWGLHPSWRVKAGVSRGTLNYVLLSQRYLNKTEIRSELGFDYLARSGNSLGLVVAHVDGNYPNEMPMGQSIFTNSYSQDEVKANVDWQVAGKTKLQLLAGPVSRSSKDVRLKDLSGFDARLTGLWLATGKLGVSAALWRETGIVDDISAIYSVNKGASVAPHWQISSKTLLEVQFRYEGRDFSQSFEGPSSFAGTGEDTLRSAALLWTYKPLHGLKMQSSIFHSSKSSDFQSNNYTRNGISLSLQQEF